MAGLTTITRQPTVLQSYQMVAPVDMFSVLNYVSSRGYTGQVVCFPHPSDPALVDWQIVLQSATRQGQQGIGIINDWFVIENDTVASICPNAQYANLYAPGS